MSYKYKIGFIGGGNMATPIIRGILNSKTAKREDIIVSDPGAPLAAEYAEITQDNQVVFDNCEYVLLAVKPQIFHTIKGTFKSIKAKCVISIMAGVTTDTITAALPSNVEVARVMPNTPCKVGAGMACVARTALSQEHKDFVYSLFANIGEAAFVEERLFDAVTSVSGSGPAYGYIFIDALTKAGVDGGLPQDVAKKLATQTILGAAKMIAADYSCDVEAMIEAVCSKGGTTIEAVKVFRAGEIDKLVSNAVEACRNRSEELSRS